MTTFALVHGAWHGAWCWERLTPELEAAGHRVVAMDLPCDDPAATFPDYAEVVLASLADADDDVVLVAHSMGGKTAPLVAARRPPRRLVYLCALVAEPGRSLADQSAQAPDMLVPDWEAGLQADDQGRSQWVDEAEARRVLYADCPEDVARAAFVRLRPQGSAGFGVPAPIDRLPDVPATYVVCRDDALVGPDWSRRIVRERVAADLVELPGDHSPFLSRPGELAHVLLDLA